MVVVGATDRLDQAGIGFRGQCERIGVVDYQELGRQAGGQRRALLDAAEPHLPPRDRPQGRGVSWRA